MPTKYYENKTVWVVLQGAFDGNAKTRRNIVRKLKNNEKLDFKKSDFQKTMKNGFGPSNIYSFSRRIRIRIQNWTKTSPRPDFINFSKIMIFMIFINLYGKGPRGPKNFPRLFCL